MRVLLVVLGGLLLAGCETAPVESNPYYYLGQACAAGDTHACEVGAQSMSQPMQLVLPQRQPIVTSGPTYCYDMSGGTVMCL